jgi:hypothetical protein
MANVETSEDNPIIALVEFLTPLEKNEQFCGFQTQCRCTTEGRGDVRQLVVRLILHGCLFALF